MQNRRQLKKELPRVDEEVRKRSRRQSGELSPVDGMERFVRVLRTGDPGGQPGGREHGAGAGCVWGALTACRSMCESLSQDTVKNSGVIFLAVEEIVRRHSVGVMQRHLVPSARTNYFRGVIALVAVVTSETWQALNAANVAAAPAAASRSQERPASAVEEVARVTKVALDVADTTTPPPSRPPQTPATGRLDGYPVGPQPRPPMHQRRQRHITLTAFTRCDMPSCGETGSMANYRIWVPDIYLP